jgi:hypothetical protein
VGSLFYPGILDHGASRWSGDDQDVAATGLLYLGGRMDNRNLGMFYNL